MSKITNFSADQKKVYDLAYNSAYYRLGGRHSCGRACRKYSSRDRNERSRNCDIRNVYSNSIALLQNRHRQRTVCNHCDCGLLRILLRADFFGYIYNFRFVRAYKRPKYWHSNYGISNVDAFYSLASNLS